MLLRTCVRLLSPIGCSKFNVLVSASAALPLLSVSVMAQEEIELPPIYVEGATLEAPPAKVKKKVAKGTTSGSAGAPSTGQTGEKGEAETRSSVQGVPINQLGSAVSVITGSQMEAEQIRFAADALRAVPGVSVNQTGTRGSKTQVRIRGAEANHTLVFIDGIEANDVSDGDFDWSNVSAFDIQQMEVIRGAQSGIYGSKAVGGVINIITRGGRGPLTASGYSEGGSFGTRSLAARLSGGTDLLWLAASTQFQASNGFNIAPQGDEEDAWRNTTVSLKGGATLLPGMTLNFVARNTKKFTEFDDDPTSFPTVSLVATDAPNTQDSRLFLGGFNLRWDLFDGAFSQEVRGNRNITHVESDSSLGNNDNLGEIDKIGYLATYHFKTPELLSAKHSFTGLIEQQDEHFTPKSSDPPGPFTPDGVTRHRGRLATVGEYRGEFYDTVFATGSVRRDDNDAFVDYTTWHSGLSVPLPKLGLRPHASAGTGVALPGMFEQFGSVIGVFKGNPDLQPEESFSWDAGVEFELVRGATFLDVTYFRANLTNEITFNSTFDSLINMPGESKRQGVEIAFHSRISPSLLVSASYTYLDATDANGAEEIRRPPHSGRADVTYLFDGGRGTFSAAAIYNGDMKDTNFGSFQTVTLGQYLLVNAGVSYRLMPNLEVFGRVENALNEDYEEVSGFNTAGIAAYAGMKMTLEDATTAAWAKYK